MSAKGHTAKWIVDHLTSVDRRKPDLLARLEAGEEGADEGDVAVVEVAAHVIREVILVTA